MPVHGVALALLNVQPCAIKARISLLLQLTGAATPVNTHLAEFKRVHETYSA